MIPAIPWKLLGSALTAVALFIGGFFTGRHHAGPQAAPQPVKVAAAPSPAQDLSPTGEKGTVTAAEIRMGEPAKPPAVPAKLAALGEHLSTTTATTQDAAPQGSRFNVSIYGDNTGNALKLRPVVWAESPNGTRLQMQTTTTEQTVSMTLGTRRPTWCASLLVEVDQALSLRPVGMLQKDIGAWRLTAAAGRNRVILGGGFVW